MPKIKNLIIITASSFFFLFLIAILARNSLFLAIFKAFFSSLVFSCTITIAWILLKKMIPELASLGTDIEVDAEIDTADVGAEVERRLNIVLDEENPHQVTDNDLIEETTDAFDSKDEEDFPEKEFVKEDQEESISNISALTPEIEDNSIEGMAEDEAGDRFPGTDASEVLTNGGNSENSSRRHHRKSSEAVGSIEIDADVSTMVKAVKTVMKRDEK